MTEKLNLAELLAEQPRRSNTCKYRIWYTGLTDDEQNTILTAFNNPNIETSHIIRSLQAYGCPSSESTIRTHRLNECKTCRR